MSTMQPTARMWYASRIAALLLVLSALAAAPIPALAASLPASIAEPPPADLLPFEEFAQTVVNGQADVLRGVYVPNVLALPIVQQPYGNPAFVSPMNGVATQFSIAAEAGNVGVLAHNYLAGRDFFKLAIGQDIHLVFGDGRIESFTVTKILRFQALSPYSPYSEFRNLEGGKTISAAELFWQVYGGPRRVTFQTCIEANNNLSWGRLFVIAEPKTPELQIPVAVQCSNSNNRRAC